MSHKARDASVSKSRKKRKSFRRIRRGSGSPMPPPQFTVSGTKNALKKRQALLRQSIKKHKSFRPNRNQERFNNLIAFGKTPPQAKAIIRRGMHATQKPKSIWSSSNINPKFVNTLTTSGKNPPQAKAIIRRDMHATQKPKSSPSKGSAFSSYRSKT